MGSGRSIVAAGIVLLMAGCQPQRERRAEPVAPTTSPSAANDAASNDDTSVRAAALARRTSSYAEALNHPNDTKAGRERPPQPSDVKFVEPAPAAPATAPTPSPASQPVVIVAPPPATAPAPVAPTVVAIAAPTTREAPVVVALASDVIDRQINKRLKDNPLDVSAHLDQQLLMLLRDQSVPDLSALSALPTEDRETISALMDCLANFRTGAASGDNLLLTKKVRPLLDLADRIRTRADLAVPIVEFCSEVIAYGRYQPMPATFTAKHEHQAIIYCEVENFSSRLDDQRQWQTKLTQSMQIYNDHGISVWQDPQHTVQDTARTRRHDFFLARKIRIPATLAAGRYTLKVTITDSQAQRLAEGTAGMELTAE